MSILEYLYRKYWSDVPMTKREKDVFCCLTRLQDRLYRTLVFGRMDEEDHRYSMGPT